MMSRRRPGSKHYQALYRRRWAAVRRAALEAAGWRCSECGGAGKLEVHHIERLENGGSQYDPDNLRVLCRSCHISLHRTDNMTPGRRDWLSFVAELTGR